MIFIFIYYALVFIIVDYYLSSYGDSWSYDAEKATEAQSKGAEEALKFLKLEL